MDIVNRLKEKQVKVREIPGWGSYLRSQWEKHFVGHLSDKEKEDIYLDGYLWHVFSYEERECLEKERANQAFNNVLKSQCFVFYQHTDYAFIIEDATPVKVKNFLKKEVLYESDIYIVDKGFTWTYVNTHEGSCGPYFSENLRRG